METADSVARDIQECCRVAIRSSVKPLQIKVAELVAEIEDLNEMETETGRAWIRQYGDDL